MMPMMSVPFWWPGAPTFQVTSPSGDLLQTSIFSLATVCRYHFLAPSRAPELLDSGLNLEHVRNLCHNPLQTGKTRVRAPSAFTSPHSPQPVPTHPSVNEPSVVDDLGDTSTYKYTRDSSSTPESCLAPPRARLTRILTLTRARDPRTLHNPNACASPDKLELDQ